MVSLVKYLWLFGDGSQSTEQSPKHTYQTPGVYTVSCTAWDEFGNEYAPIKEDYVYVYDTTTGVLGLLSGLTDFCFKLSVKAAQGCGITPMGGQGWLWPHLAAATAKGMGDNNEYISLVMDSETMGIYQIGIPGLWIDRAGGYDEQEIAGEAMLPEIESRYGPHENIRMVEAHVSNRPFDEKEYRGKEGFDDEGFKNGHTLSLEVYANGEQIVPATKLRSVHRDGDYAFLKEVEAKRIQLKLKYSTSGFRTTVISIHGQELDHRTPPQLNDGPEKIYQREFAFPDIWFSRNKPSAVTNRADGVEWTGTGSQLTGPDGKSGSGFGSSGLSGVSAYTIGDFMLSGWMIGAGTLFSGQVQGGGTVELYVSGGILTFTDGVDTISHALISSGTWRHIAVIRRGLSLEIYDAGSLRVVHALTGIRAYGGNCVVGNGSCFDIRRFSSAISAEAMYFYYESVFDGGGGFLP